MIYVVEDDEGMQEVYEGAFEENYQTRIFPNGVQRPKTRPYNSRHNVARNGRIYHSHQDKRKRRKSAGYLRKREVGRNKFRKRA